MDVLALFSTSVLGFFTSKAIAGKKVGEDGLIPSFKFGVGKYRFHIHHWFSGLALLGLLIALGIGSRLLFGFISGTAVHGLTYPDFYKFVQKNAMKNKHERKFKRRFLTFFRK